MAPSFACEPVVAAGFVAVAVADGFAFEVAAGACFASGVIFAAGFVSAEAAEESCVALEAGVCCPPEVEPCPARAGDRQIAPASSMAATPGTKVDGLKKVGFCIVIFWHPA